MEYFTTMVKFSRKIRDSKYGSRLHSIIKSMGVTIVITRIHNRMIAFRNETNPTKEMIKSRKFFEQNQERIELVFNFLEDDESRNVLRKMIKFRCFSKYSELPHNSMRNQYFINDFFQYNEKEVFIDGGAYVGDTVSAFKKIIKKKKIKNADIIAFEPEKENYEKLVQNNPDILAFQAGLWSENGILSFSGMDVSGGISSQNLSSDRKMKVMVKSIDCIPECEKATFIKMDIEGSEYEAILGAKKVICKNRPKLAICIYHSDEDMLRLAELIHDMVPEYHIYIRQHCNSRAETVLYCQI